LMGKNGGPFAAAPARLAATSTTPCRGTGTIPVIGAALDPNKPCRALKAHRCGCSWRRPLDHRHSHDWGRLCCEPVAGRPAFRNGQAHAADLALVRSALALVCRGSQQGGWTVSQVVKRKPRHESGRSLASDRRLGAHVPPTGGTSRSFLRASARSMARSACDAASAFVAAWPVAERSASSETDHFQTCRPSP
jgi:hypothetical protein